MATTPVKFFYEGMAGAATLSGTVGTMISVLDQCLVDGFNSGSVSALSVSNYVLTGTRTSHGFIQYQTIEIAGANESQLNGQWKLTSVTTNTFTAAAPSVADVTGTGTITAKTASAGWTKAFSGTNKAAYKSSDVDGNPMYLRVDDSAAAPNARYANVRGYETMSDIDNGTGMFPTSALTATSVWYKSGQLNTTARQWTIVADSKMFYFMRGAAFQTYQGTTDVFGEFSSTLYGDAFNTVLSTQIETILEGSQHQWPLSSTTLYSNTSAKVYLPRAYTQLGGAVNAANGFYHVNGGQPVSGVGWAYPNPMSNKLIVARTMLHDGTDIRCLAMPGLYNSPTYCTAIPHMSTVTNIDGADGRVLLSVLTEANAVYGRLFYDITGPWR